MENKRIGKPVAYTPEAFYEKAQEYFDYAKNNPVCIEVPSKAGPMLISKRYPINIYDFCRYAGIHRDTFYEYKNQAAYSDTCKFIDTTIKAEQFMGAMTSEFNSNFVCRINDLAENVNSKVTEERVIKHITKDQAAEIIADQE